MFKPSLSTLHMSAQVAWLMPMNPSRLFQLFVYNFSKKTTASQTYFGFTNKASEVLSFRVIAIWNSGFWFRSPCNKEIQRRNVDLIMAFEKEPKVNENSQKKCLMMSNKTQPLLFKWVLKKGFICLMSAQLPSSSGLRARAVHLKVPEYFWNRMIQE